ncbi:PREDICTED: uncharacterized protein LOC109233235 [Nicotiana attenuata]|uniref:Uncharacterized protein n=1 Tax=Nicotiana attenuata TaxID=49451 RepID=A0A1J6IBJ7_NICAT|nr:PREDICTED: uncharacterized protein LOC109233235 [Nicotiana attenuata]OIS97895.1 hypothetical protein A4A49_27393 [Nicotiana attenuata]
MPSGAKKRKAAKKKKELQAKDPSYSHGEDLKHDGSESLNINIEQVEPGKEPPEKGLRRSSSSSSSSSSRSSSSSDEKPAVVDKNFSVDNAPPGELVKEPDSFANDQVAENLPGTDARKSIVETASLSDLDKASLSEDAIQVTTGSSNTDNVTTSHTVEPAMKGNLGFVDGKATVSEVLLELEKRIDEASETLHDGAVAASDAKAFAVKEDEDKLELSYNAPTVDVTVHPDNVKDTPTRECYEHQPVALAPRPVQTTSWKSCCGLFEVFAGSNT